MKIAIIGTGISGLGSAYLLDKKYDLTIFEKNDYIGGHSRTLDIEIENKKIAVDTGFIVFNHWNYPNLVGLFNELNVETAKSNMSFGVSHNNGKFEYGTLKASNMFCQKTNIFKPKFWRFLKDLFHFNKQAYSYTQKNPKASMGDLIKDLNLSEWFKNYYLFAMGASIWSMPLKQIYDFPAKTFIQFFKNHGLLTIKDHPEWYTVKGGSRNYVKKIIKNLKSEIKLNNAVLSVERKKDHIELIDQNKKSYKFDQVIFACHSDQAFKILKNPNKQEKEILSNCKYQKNEVVLHCDTSFMPKRKKAWSSWVYLSEKNNNNVSLSYWMNNLQPLTTKTPIIVTLNPSRKPDPKLTFNTHTLEHPIFDQNAITAQTQLNSLKEQDRIHYAGAWTRYGFHEDGLLSAVNIAKKLNVEIPWQ